LFLHPLLQPNQLLPVSLILLLLVIALVAFLLDVLVEGLSVFVLGVT
jgi:hypothetical protein